jgi:hypothetical protein
MKKKQQLSPVLHALGSRRASQLLRRAADRSGDLPFTLRTRVANLGRA